MLVLKSVFTTENETNIPLQVVQIMIFLSSLTSLAHHIQPVFL